VATAYSCPAAWKGLCVALLSTTLPWLLGFMETPWASAYVRVGAPALGRFCGLLRAGGL
jgi:hypothetical protein